MGLMGFDPLYPKILNLSDNTFIYYWFFEGDVGTLKLTLHKLFYATYLHISWFLFMYNVKLFQ